MLNLFGKRRHIIIRKSNIVEILEILSKYDLTISDIANMKIGCCGWANEPDAWFLFITVNDKIWYNVINDFKNSNIELLPETARYV